MHYLKQYPSCRLLFVGDINQAIYGFRGSHPNSIQGIINACQILTEREPREFHLFETQRCPVSHVKLVKPLVPQLTTKKSENGILYWIPEDMASQRYKVGDLILSRLNRPIFKEAYKLFQLSVPTKIIGEIEFKVATFYFISCIIF